MIEAAVLQPADAPSQASSANVPLKLFASYAHEDEPFRAALEKYLIVLKLQGAIEHWDDRKLAPGDTWHSEISENLEKAHIIVLLVSIDFLNSDYIRTTEMRRAMERNGTGEAAVIPVLVRATPDWDKVLGLGTLQGLPVRPGAETELLPIKKWPDPDEAWECVIGGLRRTIEKIRTRLRDRATSAVPVSQPTPPPTPSEASAVSADGLKALRTLMADATIRAVAKQFSEDFTAASNQISVLSDYKDLHDALHSLQFQCYNFALLESRRANAMEINWAGLGPESNTPASTLRQVITTISGVAERMTLPKEESAFLAELMTADTELASAVENADPAPLKKATHRIGRVLAIRPSQINFRLLDAAEKLPLADLEASMAKIRGQISPSDLASPEGGRFSDGVDALSQLRAGVEALCKEHDSWQEVDAEMRRIEAQLGTDLGDLEFSWEGLKKNISVLSKPEKGEWAAALTDEIHKLDSALAAGIAPKITQAFRRCYSKAGTRFYNVDFELKTLCDKLRKVGTELDRILKTK